MAEYLLEMRNVTKRFPGVLALDHVSLQLREGEILGICGENGAGKSTLMKILSGTYPHGTYEGDILYNGHPLRKRSFCRALEQLSDYAQEGCL